MITDGESTWVTQFEPSSKEHPYSEIIPLYTRPTSDLAERISDDEDDEEWAKFRLLIKDCQWANSAFEDGNSILAEFRKANNQNKEGGVNN